MGALGADEGGCGAVGDGQVRVGPAVSQRPGSPSQSCGTRRKGGLASLSLSPRKGQECHGLVP